MVYFRHPRETSRYRHRATMHQSPLLIVELEGGLDAVISLGAQPRAGPAPGRVELFADSGGTTSALLESSFTTADQAQKQSRAPAATRT